VRLEIDDETPVDGPTVDGVRDALLRLSASGRQWAVLDIGFNYYIQTRVLDDGQFAVEYREGGPDQHYGAADPQHLEAVVDAFLSYLADDNRWRTAFAWRRMTLP
jgi:hypothetical protein